MQENSRDKNKGVGEEKKDLIEKKKKVQRRIVDLYQKILALNEENTTSKELIKLRKEGHALTEEEEILSKRIKEIEEQEKQNFFQKIEKDLDKKLKEIGKEGPNVYLPW